MVEKVTACVGDVGAIGQTGRADCQVSETDQGTDAPG